MKACRWGAILGAFAVLGWVSIGDAADSHHALMAKEGGPTEGGQSAFAALAEIVAILEADPATDWSEIDISALHQHLVDMSELTLKATAIERPIENGLEIMVAGDGPTRDSIQRMVPAHAAELNKIPGWSASANVTNEGATLVVMSSEPAVQSRIQGLGFFGLMATGSHHQAHHLAIAKGEPLHSHQ